MREDVSSVLLPSVCHLFAMSWYWHTPTHPTPLLTTQVEGIRETLKNVLLVMDAQDVYQIIGEDMRDCTWAIIGKCRPLSDLQEQLAAESAELREVAVAQQHPHEEASAVPLETGHADKDPEVVGMMERFNWVVVTDRDLQESGPEEDLDETSPPVDYAATELDLR